MKTKKILLGSLLVLATAMTAANLWADSNPPPQPMEQCKWRIVNCVCVWDPPPPFSNAYYCSFDECAEAVENCNPQ